MPVPRAPPGPTSASAVAVAVAVAAAVTMGKKKKGRSIKPQKTGKRKVPTTFNCPFCNNSETVECKIDKIRQVGKIECRVCGAAFQTKTTVISAPIDIYSEWIDKAAETNL